MAKYNFDQITESPVKYVFIVNLAKKQEQQKLSTELKGTIHETKQFAIAYEEGATRQQSFKKWKNEEQA